MKEKLVKENVCMSFSIFNWCMIIYSEWDEHFKIWVYFILLFKFKFEINLWEASLFFNDSTIRNLKNNNNNNNNNKVLVIMNDK